MSGEMFVISTQTCFLCISFPLDIVISTSPHKNDYEALHVAHSCLCLLLFKIWFEHWCSMTLCLAVNLLYSKQKKNIKLPNWGLCFLQSLEGITGFSLAFLRLLFDLPRLPQLHMLSFESVASSFVFVFLTIMLSDAMPKDLFLLNLPCSDVYIRGASALIFVTKCESETESSRGTHLQWIQTQGFFEQMFFVFVLYKYWCIFW